MFLGFYFAAYKGVSKVFKTPFSFVATINSLCTSNIIVTDVFSAEEGYHVEKTNA